MLLILEVIPCSLKTFNPCAVPHMVLSDSQSNDKVNLKGSLFYFKVQKKLDVKPLDTQKINFKVTPWYKRCSLFIVDDKPGIM